VTVSAFVTAGKVADVVTVIVEAVEVKLPVAVVKFAQDAFSSVTGVVLIDAAKVGIAEATTPTRTVADKPPIIKNLRDSLIFMIDLQCIYSFNLLR
jgi:hypothetical protein